MGVYFPYDIMNLTLCLLSILYSSTLLLLPESPYFYYMKGRDEEGLQSLMRFRGKKNPESVKIEVQEVRQLACEIQEQSKIKLLEIFKSRTNRRAFLIVIGANFTTVLSGNTVMVSYTQENFKYSGFSLSASNSVTVLIGVIIISGLIGSQVIEKGDRRFIFLFSGISTGASLTIAGLFFFLKYQMKINIASFTSMPLMGLIIYAIGFPLGLGKIPFILEGEIFSMNLKNIAVSFCNLLCPLLTFSTGLIFPFINDTVGIYASFWVFALCSFICTFIFFRIAPKTKGKSLNEIQTILKSR
ncbi:facilitated trehalose transporter Tret1-like [Belonocnema kinseyi]|uniref:facilitated trehalose transporter Tret1-like n=1 Tax=Belonocnema kinseyi TaxID=2817044 RepID=UPI00143CD3CF|nr:facilitated trehalose transporter Tret1-like [Belonocnema kinseyi]